MADKRRVRNAVRKTVDGIEFKSLAEVMVYKTLLSEGIEPSYEKESFKVFDGCTPTVPFYTKNKFKRKNKNIDVLSGNTCVDYRPVTSMHYTPDFTFDYGGKHIIVEVKGFSTELYLYRIKLFRAYLEGLNDKENIEFWEIHTKKQLLDCLKHLKETTPDDSNPKGT